MEIQYTTSIYNLIHFLERKWGFIMLWVVLVHSLKVKKTHDRRKNYYKKNSEVTKIITDKNKVIGVEINQDKNFCR